MNYFYIENNEQKGPFNLEELQKLSINQKTLIWHEGLEDWIEAQNSNDLESLFNKTMPPKIPISNIEPPKFQSSKPSISHEPRTVEQNKSKVKITVIASSAVAVLLIGVYLLTKNDTNSGSNGYTDDTSYSESNNSPTNDGLSNSQTQNQESNDNSSAKNQQQYPQKPRQLTEDEIREKLYDKEVSNPTNYLTASGTYRVNLAANTIIEGTVSNSASIAGFKNIEITAKFYSKTGVLLGNESFLVMDFISPNGSLTFKDKISGWWSNIDHWTLTVNSAESY
jgi:hypothetical protein